MEETRDRKINAFRISLNFFHCRVDEEKISLIPARVARSILFTKLHGLANSVPQLLHLSEQLHLGGTKMRYSSQHFRFIDVYLPPPLPISSNCLFYCRTQAPSRAYLIAKVALAVRRDTPVLRRHG